MAGEHSDKGWEEIRDTVCEWGGEFSKSPHFEQLTEEQKRVSEFVVMTFTQYMYNHHESSPREWNEFGLKECCQYTLPRKISAGESYYKSLAPVLSAFFAFLGENNLLENAPELIRTVKNIDEQVIENARDRNNWGPAKSFVMAAKDAGVDITNEQEMQQYMVAYILRLARSKEDARPGSALRPEKPKIGRNAPCPCGSGKRYRKCCGKEHGSRC